MLILLFALFNTLFLAILIPGIILLELRRLLLYCDFLEDPLSIKSLNKLLLFSSATPVKSLVSDNIFIKFAG